MQNMFSVVKLRVVYDKIITFELNLTAIAL